MLSYLVGIHVYPPLLQRQVRLWDMNLCARLPVCFIDLFINQLINLFIYLVIYLFFFIYYF